MDMGFFPIGKLSVNKETQGFVQQPRKPSQKTRNATIFIYLLHSEVPLKIAKLLSLHKRAAVLA
jgi:hypothetical protein